MTSWRANFTAAAATKHAAGQRALPRLPLTKEQAALVDSCQGMVRSLAWRTQMKVGKLIELDDLIADGQLGLIEAARNYDPSRGIAFTTFAHHRIRGSILDGLNKLAWFSRAAMDSARYEHLVSDFFATDQETINEEPAARFVKTTRSVAVSFLLRSDASAALAVIEDKAQRPADSGMIGEEMRLMMRRAIDELPPQVAQLVRWTYFEGLNLTQAGQRLGVGKAWASRLHARALELLAQKLKKLGYEH